MKSKSTAYLFWLISPFGILGLHYFYLGKIGRGILCVLTGNFCMIGAFIDLFTLGGTVENINTKEELKTIRTATNAMATKMNNDMK